MRPFEIRPGLRVTRPIAEGATSVVFLAEVTEPLPYALPGTILAVKLFRRQPTGKAKERFFRELQIGLEINSDFLVRNFEYGEYESEVDLRPYIVMEHVNGVSIHEAINKANVNSSDFAHFISMTLFNILSSLAVLHDHGIIHRDLQPANIIQRTDGRTILLDYGCSKHLEQSGVTSVWEEIGTRRYWAPECLEPELDIWQPATDLFMLASCFVHLLGGRYLFGDKLNYHTFFSELSNYGKKLGLLANRPKEWDELPEDIGKVVKFVLWAMLAPSPAERPPIKELISILNGSCPVISTDRTIKGYPLTALVWHMRDDKELAVLSYLGALYDKGGPNAQVDCDELYRYMPSSYDGILKGNHAVNFLAHWGLLEMISGQGPFNEDDNSNYWPTYHPTSAASAVWHAVRENQCHVDTVFKIRKSVDLCYSDKKLIKKDYLAFLYLATDGVEQILMPPDANALSWQYEWAIANCLLPEVLLQETAMVRKRANMPLVITENDGEEL